MGRIIDEEDVLKILCHELCHPGIGCPDGYCEEVRKKLKKVPAADAVPVVRCKDCNEYQEKFRWCKMHDEEMQPTDFCSYAERRSDGAAD